VRKERPSAYSRQRRLPVKRTPQQQAALNERMAKVRAVQLAGKGKIGRSKGQPNAITVEVKLAAQAIVDDPIYRANLLIAMRERTVAPAVETMLWYYAKGKPKETIVVDGSFTVGWIDSVPPEPQLPVIDVEAQKHEGQG
jgi:hypothetical protein